jgi:hypothetical protein
MAETKDIKQIHSILRLLDDDSPRVRDKVWDTLSANLPDWEEPLREAVEGLPVGPRKRLQELLADRDRESFRRTWVAWRDEADDYARLEAALGALSGFLARQAGETAGTGTLSALLDGLAAEFRDGGEPPVPSRLAHFLFETKGLRGADTDYYEPRNSDLVHVLRTGRGIPIALACVFMLVGRRLGLSIHGCDVPEHFLTRAEENGESIVIDCYDGGKVLGRDRLAQLERKYAPDFMRILRHAASAESMVARVLRNLINAFHLAGRKEASDFMWTLAEDLRGGTEDPA